MSLTTSDASYFRRWRGAVPARPAGQKLPLPSPSTGDWGSRHAVNSWWSRGGGQMNGTSPSGWPAVWTAFVVAVFGWGVGFYGPTGIS